MVFNQKSLRGNNLVDMSFVISKHWATHYLPHEIRKGSWKHLHFCALRSTRTKESRQVGEKGN